MRIRWLKTALASLYEIRDYIAVDNQKAAESVAERVQRIAQRLQEFPLSGRVGIIAGTREIVIAGLPYIIQYRVTDTEIHILRVYHAKRQIL